MRELKEIKDDMTFVDREIEALKEKRKALQEEKDERSFADFCEKYGVICGDIVELDDKEHLRVQIVGMNSRWSDWVVCRKIKKNGEPYRYTSSYLPTHFYGCKVIKHHES